MASPSLPFLVACRPTLSNGFHLESSGNAITKRRSERTDVNRISAAVAVVTIATEAEAGRESAVAVAIAGRLAVTLHFQLSRPCLLCLPLLGRGQVVLHHPRV